MKIIEGVNPKKSGKVSQMQIFKAIFWVFLHYMVYEFLKKNFLLGF